MRRRQFLGLAAGTLLAAGDAPGASARTYGGTPVALVTADAEAHVVACHLGTGRVVRRIPTVAGPRSIETVDQSSTALVAHTGHGVITLLDAATLHVRREIDGFAEPRYTAAHPAGRYAYVTDSALGQLVVVDVGRGRIARRVEIGAHARHVTIHPGGAALWVALGTKAPALAVLDLTDPARPRLRGRLEPLDLAHDVGFSADGSRVWVTSGVDGRLVLHDARTRRRLAVLPAGTPPQHVVLLPARVYVTSGDDGTLDVHRPAGGPVRRRTAIPVGSYNVTSGWGRILSPSLDRGTLTVLDGRGALLTRERVARAAHDACFVVSR